jgi:hypothetical protein
MKILYIGNSDINGYSYYQYKIIKNKKIKTKNINSPILKKLGKFKIKEN